MSAAGDGTCGNVLKSLEAEMGLCGDPAISWNYLKLNLSSLCLLLMALSDLFMGTLGEGVAFYTLHPDG